MQERETRPGPRVLVVDDDPALVRVVRAIVEARTRMYLDAVTDPVTGRIDPELERQVLRMMAL